MLNQTRWLCALLLLSPALPAHAGQRTADANVSEFDPARSGSQRGDDRRFRIDTDESRRFQSDKLGPHWSYVPISGGPKLEMAALGAGRKGAPKLAHVGVDWSF